MIVIFSFFTLPPPYSIALSNCPSFSLARAHAMLILPKKYHLMLTALKIPRHTCSLIIAISM